MFENEPINRIEWRDVDTLQANDWNPNRVFTEEFKLLIRNILVYGWIQPVLINPNGIIIDGFHRTGISRDVPEVREKYGGKVPCVVMDIPDDKAMILTVRMNRAKGTHGGAPMSEIVRTLINDYGYDANMLREELGMTSREVDLLFSNSLWKEKRLGDMAYSKAWVPTNTKAKEPEPLDRIYRDDEGKA